MPYSRINMVEFESREEMHNVITNLSVNMKTVFPEIRSFVSVEKSEKSQITISVYDYKEAADRAVAQRDTHLEHRELVDIFVHQGNVNCVCVEKEQLTNLLNGGCDFKLTALHALAKRQRHPSQS